MIKVKRIISLVLAVSVAATLFAGCGKKVPQKNVKDENDSAVAQEGFPIIKNKITLKFLCAKEAKETPYENMDFFIEYEKMSNIHIEWDNPPSDSFKERYNLVVASGDLPDAIIKIPQPQYTDIAKFAKAGVAIPISNYIDKYAPNIKKVFEKYPLIKKSIYGHDGKFYHISRVAPTDQEAGSMRLSNNYQVREDWLKKLNLKEPVTTEDWYNVWKAFKEKDPNGNGKADEIPFTAISGTNIMNLLGLVRAWGVDLDFYVAKDGKTIQYAPIEDRYKEAITWMAKMYKEGLIDQEVATNNDKTFQAKVAQNIIGSYRGNNGHQNTFNSSLPKSIPGFKMIGTAPMKGPYGDQRETLSGIENGGFSIITSANKHPEATVRWFDYFYSDEGSKIVTFGTKEGKTYTKDSQGNYKYTDYVLKNPDGLSSKDVTATYSPAGVLWPMMRRLDSSEQALTEDNRNGFKKMLAFATEQLPLFTFEKEQDEIERAVMVDVKSYMDEQILKFILGVQPMSKWDEYVKRMKEMGIDKAVKIRQDAYDKWLKK